MSNNARILALRRRGATALVVAAVSLLVALTTSRGVSQTKEKTQSPSGPTLRVSTNVVNIYAVVRDKQRRLVPNLNREDFELTEENSPQEVRYFARESDKPLTLGILIDTSLSQERVLTIEREQAKVFAREVVRPKDLAFVLHFDVDVELLQELTSDTSSLARAVDQTAINKGIRPPLSGNVPCKSPRGIFDRINRAGTDVENNQFPRIPMPGGIPNDFGDTHLLDALYLASQEVLKNEAGRKAIILLGDGADQGSRVSLNAALEAAHRADVIVYCLAIVDRSMHTDFCRRRQECLQGPSLLRKLAQETGGRVIDVHHAGDTSKAFQEIAEELRTEYFLGYTPSELRHDGSYRKIRLRVGNGNYTVQARRGYYAPKD